MERESEGRFRIFAFLKLRKEGAGGKMVVLGSGMIIVLVTMMVLTTFLAYSGIYYPYNPNLAAVNCAAGKLCAVPPSPKNIMGTNQLGEDIFTHMLYGGSTMIQVAILSVLICLAVGVPLGLFAGYVSGLWDRAASLAMDSLYAFPGLVLAIAIASVLGTGVVNLAISIAVVYIPSYFRVVRSQVLSLKEYPFVEAVKVAGARTPHVLFRQILPNVIPSIAVIGSINVADAVLTEAGLTYLGLGVPLAGVLPDWGWDIYYGKTLFLSGAWWAWFFPGMMIVLLAAGFTLIGEGLGEVWNPKLRR
ncbi:MAG: ABC transporter permease [Thaumarchaeota archaeon]|nr:ABC transporter permease [Nitrososphaerota archaeon]